MEILDQTRSVLLLRGRFSRNHRHCSRSDATRSTLHSKERNPQSMSRFLCDGSFEGNCHYRRSHFVLSRFLEERNLPRHRFVDLFIVHFILLCFPRCECTILHLFLSNRRISVELTQRSFE